MSEFKFSVIIAAYNSDLWISQTLDSLINQTLDFEDNIQVIIVNDGSTDNTRFIAQEYKSRYPKNIKFIESSENKGPAYARNLGIKQAGGKYINFLDSDDYFSKTTFRHILNFYEKNDVDLVSVPIFFFGKKNGEHILNFKYEKNRVIDLVENPEYIQLSSSSCFFKREAVGGLKFNEKLFTSEDVVFINQLLLDNPKIGFCNKGKYYYRKREENSSIIDNSTITKEYFNTRLKHYFKFLIDESIEKYGEVPKFIQYTLMYDLQWLFDIPSVNKILTVSEIKELRKYLYEIIQYIEDDVIYKQKHIENILKANILFFKYKNKSDIEEFQDSIVEKLKLNTVYIDIFDIMEDKLYVLGNLPTEMNNTVEVYVNGNKINIKQLNFPQRDKYSLSYKYATNYSFEFELPLKKEETYEIEFKSPTRKFSDLYIDFSRPCNFSRTVGYAKTKDFISTLKDNKKIIIKEKNNVEWVKKEFKTLYNMLKNHSQGYKTGIPIRILYLLTYPFMKNKRIWLFMDLPNIADDNAKHLFKYSQDKNKEIKKYFVLKKDSKHWADMKKIGKVLNYKSIKHRLISLYAEKIITSHPDNNIIYPFWGNYPYFAGIMKSSTIFLQHGITKDNVSSWLNKYDKNLIMFLTVSKLEYLSIFKYPYNYKKETVRLLGFPRFDNLKNEKDKKQILIMPSWRRYLKYKSNEVILNSQFFKKFNSLINNEKLIESCEKYGYEIIFKPHPNVYDFIDLFDRNKYVKIDYANEKYQDYFNSGSLLVTDYSSVAFDFAYLYKPVLYYHYQNDYHFNLNESYYNYDTMGFGEISKKEDELVNNIIEYMKNDCKLKEKYERRIKAYFLYTDDNNCMRVYDAIRRLPKKL